MPRVPPLTSSAFTNGIAEVYERFVASGPFRDDDGRSGSFDNIKSEPTAKELQS